MAGLSFPAGRWGGCCGSGRRGVRCFLERVALGFVGMLGAFMPFISPGSGGAGPFVSSSRHGHIQSCRRARG